MAISKTQGAVILDEVINRHKIERHRGAFCRAALEAGGPEHFMDGMGHRKGAVYPGQGEL